MKYVTISALAVLALLGGCKKESAHEGDPPAAAAAAASMPPELAKFHDLIKPLWHADPGDKRTADTCAAVPAIQAQADVVAKAAAPPTADAAKWAAATKELVDASAALKAPCDAKDGPGFEAAFKRVHEGFHGLLGASGAMHDEGGEHEHEMGHRE